MESEESTAAMASEEEKAPLASPGNSSIVSSSSSHLTAAAADGQYPQLQNELTMLKEQLFEAEAGFRRRKAILEQEIRDNDSAAQSKIEQFQSKFVQLTEDARRSENSYKSEIFLLEESIAQLESAWQARLDHLEQRMGQQNEGQRTELERLFGVIEQRFNQLKESQNQERELLSDHVELSLAQQNDIHGKDIERIIDRSIQREKQLAQRMEQEKLARDKEIAALVNHIGENDAKIKATGADHRSEFLLLEASIQKQKEAHKREIDNLIGVLHQQEEKLRATNEDHETLKQSMAKDNSMLQTYLRHIEQTLAQQNENHQKEIERVTSQANQREEAVKQLLAQQKEGQDRAAHRILDHVRKVMEQQKEIHDNEIAALAKHIGKNEHETRKSNEAQTAAMAQLEQRLEEEKMYRTEEVESLNMHLSQLREELDIAREENEALKEASAKEASTFQELVQNLKGTIKEHAESFGDYKVEQQQAKADFQATLSSHRDWFKELERSIKQQSIDILAASDEFNAGKEDVESMVRSWISEYENMHQEVEGISEEFETTKMQVQSTNESFDQLRENVEKLGESWEALFEHMASQVQEETIERKAADREQESMHKSLEGMIEVRNDDVDEQISRIVQAANEQKATTDKIKGSIDKHDDEIIMLQQLMGASNLQMETFEKRLNEQADVQTLTRNEHADLKTTVTKLHVDGQDRIKSLEDKIGQDSSEQAKTSAKLERKLQAHGVRLDSMDEQLTRHDTSVEELWSKTHQMHERDTQRSIEAVESTRETAELIQTRKVELDGLKSTLNALQENWGASSAQIETVEKKLNAQAQLQSSTNTNVEDLTVQLGILEETSESRFSLLQTKTEHLEDQASKSERLESEIFKHESRFHSVHDQLARFDSTFPELLKKVQQQESAHLALGENLAQAQRTSNEQFETCRDEIAELATRVRDRADKQSATNDAVRKGLKEHKLSLSALQVAVSESSKKVDVIPKLLQEHDSDYKAAIAVIQSSVNNKINAKIEEAKMRLEQSEQKIDEQLKATEVRMETKLDDYDKKVAEQATDVSSLRVVVSESSNKLEAIPKLIEEQAIGHNAAIAAVESNVNKKIDAEIGNVKMHLEQMEQQTNEHLEETAAEMKTKLIDHDAKLANQATDLSAMQATISESSNKLEAIPKLINEKDHGHKTAIAAIQSCVDKKIDTEIGVVKLRLEQTEQHADEQLKAATAKLQSKVVDHDGKLTEQATNLSALQDTVSESSKKLEMIPKLIDKKESGHNAAIEAVQRNMDENIDAKILTVKMRLDQVKQQSDEQVKASAATLEMKLVDHDARLTQQGTDISALLADVSESSKKLEAIPNLVEEQARDYQAAIAAVESNFDERIDSKIGEVTMHLEQSELKTDERLTATEAKLEMNLVDQEAKFTKLGANLVTVNNKVGKLKQDIAKQADLLNTAKEARAVIRSDMLSMMQSLKAQDDHLAQQLKEKTESLDTKENMLVTSLEEQRTEHQLLKGNLERYQTEVREQHETGIRGLDAKLLAATSSLGNLQNAAESKAKDLARFEDRLRSAEEQQSKYNAEARERLEEGLRNLEVKVQAQDEELAQQLKEQIVGLDATDSILTKSMEEQRAEHQLLKRKLELYNKELRQMQETATISLRELENAVKMQASEQTSSNEALEEVTSNLAIAATCLKELEDTVVKQSSEQMATKEAFEKFSSQLRARLEWVEGHQKKSSKELREQHEAGLHQLNSELSVVMTSLREIEETALSQANEQAVIKEAVDGTNSKLNALEKEGWKLDVAVTTLKELEITVEENSKATTEEFEDASSKLNAVTTSLKELEETVVTKASEQMAMKEVLEKTSSQLESGLYTVEGHQKKTSEVSASGNLEQLSKEVYDRLDFVEVQQSKTMKAVERMDYQLKHHNDLEREQPYMARAETPKDTENIIRDTKKKQNSGLKKRREEIKELIASARSDVCFSITEGDDESRDASSVARE